MFLVAAHSATYWHLPNFWQTTAYYLFGPLVILVINWMGVKVWRMTIFFTSLTVLQWFGWVEGVFGIVKLFFVAAGALFLLIVGAKSKCDHLERLAQLTDIPRWI
jgi:hypothetical protein